MLKLASLLVGSLLLAGTVGVCTQVAAKPRSIPPASPPPPECLSRPAGDIFAPNVTSGTLNRLDIGVNQTADFRGKPLVENPPTYALVIGEGKEGACVTGLKMTGQQSTSLSWRQMKDLHDGDAILWKNATGQNTVTERSHFVNVMDGVSPRASDIAYNWIVRGVFMDHVRDDAIENDQCLAGLIEDSLVDGVFMGFSSRPGSNNECPSYAVKNNVFRVKNVLLRLECMPYPDTDNGDPQNSCGSGEGVGQLFKWKGSSPLKVDVRDSIFVVPSQSLNGPNSMCFPAGTYSNVTLIWQGLGPYPCSLPAGVTQTKDITIWDQARADWLQRYGCAADGSSCPFTSP